MATSTHEVSAKNWKSPKKVSTGNRQIKFRTKSAPMRTNNDKTSSQKWKSSSKVKREKTRPKSVPTYTGSPPTMYKDAVDGFRGTYAGLTVAQVKSFEKICSLLSDAEKITSENTKRKIIKSIHSVDPSIAIESIEEALVKVAQSSVRRCECFFKIISHDNGPIKDENTRNMFKYAATKVNDIHFINKLYRMQQSRRPSKFPNLMFNFIEIQKIPFLGLSPKLLRREIDRLSKEAKSDITMSPYVKTPYLIPEIIELEKEREEEKAKGEAERRRRAKSAKDTRRATKVSRSDLVWSLSSEKNQRRKETPVERKGKSETGTKRPKSEKQVRVRKLTDFATRPSLAEIPLNEASERVLSVWVPNSLKHLFQADSQFCTEPAMKSFPKDGEYIAERYKIKIPKNVSRPVAHLPRLLHKQLKYAPFLLKWSEKLLYEQRIRKANDAYYDSLRNYLTEYSKEFNKLLKLDDIPKSLQAQFCLAVEVYSSTNPNSYLVQNVWEPSETRAKRNAQIARSDFYIPFK